MTTNTNPCASRREFLRCAGLLASAPLVGGMREARLPHFRPRARSVIFLGQMGAPSQLDLFDPKPMLRVRDGEEMPASVVDERAIDQLRGRRLVIAGSRFGFRRHGVSGLELSELLPNLGAVADKIVLVRSMHTDVVNHQPAASLLFTGDARAGRPSLGAWVMQGRGTENPKLPGFLVLTSGPGGSQLGANLWGNAFLPGERQGVRLSPSGDPVPFLSGELALSPAARRSRLDAVLALNERHHQRTRDAQVRVRSEAYELAYEMQESVPGLVRFEEEDARTLALYGADSDTPSYARNCLLARRMVERGVRFVQLMHTGWDHHEQLPRRLPERCAEVDRASAALLVDLERRGLLDETLVVWAGEFGRTPMQQGGRGGLDHGRDHHGAAFSVWMAGGGCRAGLVLGQTDEFGYHVVEQPVHVHDLQATILHQLGLDHTRLTYLHHGREFRLTDVGGHVVDELIA